MLSEQEVLRFAPLVKDLEATEPVLCSWRVEVSQQRPEVRMAGLRWMARAMQSAATHGKPLQAPEPGQVVALTTAMTPATIGTLRPVLAELARRGRPAFLITQPKTRAVLEEGLHRGHADIFEIAAQAGLSWRYKAFRQAGALATELVRSVPYETVNGAAQWIELGMAVREGVRHWLGSAGCVIADSDTAAFRKGFCLGAEALGVPTYVLQHGLLGSHQFPLHARQLFCWGEYFRRQSRDYGLPLERTVSIGSPRWDPLTRLRDEARSPELHARIANGRPGPTVLVISTAHAAAAYPELYRPFFESVRRLVEAGVNVALRLHPAEQGTAAYQEHLSSGILDQIFVVPADISLHAAILHSDLVYQISSAASLESMLLGTPVLFERGEGDQGNLADFPENGGGVWSTLEEVVALAQSLGSAGSARRDALDKQEAFLQDTLSNRGSATGVAADYLLGEAGSSIGVVRESRLISGYGAGEPHQLQ